MRIDVAAILKEPGESLPFDITGNFEGLTIDGGAALLRGPLTVRGVVTSVGDGVYIEANVRGAVTLTCSRCLTEFERPVDFSCEGRFGGHARDEEEDLDEDEVEVFPLDGTFCDLGEMIGHEIVLSLPMKPLCDDACKGLCPKCGKNLNEGDCDCAKEEDRTSAFGEKLRKALEERSKKDGRPEKETLGF